MRCGHVSSSRSWAITSVLAIVPIALLVAVFAAIALIPRRVAIAMRHRRVSSILPGCRSPSCRSVIRALLGSVSSRIVRHVVRLQTQVGSVAGARAGPGGVLAESLVCVVLCVASVGRRVGSHVQIYVVLHEMVPRRADIGRRLSVMAVGQYSQLYGWGEMRDKETNSEQSGPRSRNTAQEDGRR